MEVESAAGKAACNLENKVDAAGCCSSKSRAGVSRAIERAYPKVIELAMAYNLTLLAVVSLSTLLLDPIRHQVTSHSL